MRSRLATTKPPKAPRPPRRHEATHGTWKHKRQRALRAQAFAALKLCPTCGERAVRQVDGAWGYWHLDERHCPFGHYWAFDRRTMTRVIGLGYRMDRQTGAPLDKPGTPGARWSYPRWSMHRDEDVPL